MTTLRETLTAPDKKPAVVADLTTLIEGEVAGMGGLTGIAAKAAFSAAKKQKPDVVQRGSAAYLGTLADALDPFWQRSNAEGGDFPAYVTAHQDEVGAALQAKIESEVTAGGKERAMFDKFKGQIAKVMVGALPKLAALVQKHAG
ncbi:hypothetical protein [Miniimonas sp. S16]|uniref:DUF6918 family protein n=1 Tax=Miniimonas sp. S16 TaxID=2171623 RepID=UPI000D52A073|nr:hypothetical protein [Miniimonas sp. S16]